MGTKRHSFSVFFTITVQLLYVFKIGGLIDHCRDHNGYLGTAPIIPCDMELDASFLLLDWTDVVLIPAATKLCLRPR